MPKPTKPSGVAHLSYVYVTIGSLMLVWTLVWYWYQPPETPRGGFWVTGFALTGLILIVLGLGLGRIGRTAREAELPPEEASVTAAEPANPPEEIPEARPVAALRQPAEPRPVASVNRSRGD